jgi:hypothetical protein
MVMESREKLADKPVVDKCYPPAGWTLGIIEDFSGVRKRICRKTTG